MPQHHGQAGPPGNGSAPATAARRIIRRRPVGEWALAAVLLAVIAWFLGIFVGNDAIEWALVREYLFDERILEGVVVTLELTLMVMGFAAVLGTLVAFMRMSANPVIAGGSWLFVWIFRAVPVLVWLLFWYFLAALVPFLRIGVPLGPTLLEIPTNDVIGQMGAAVLGLGLTEAAYMAEIVRGGILSIGRGQREAALALGMTPSQGMRIVVLPQALKSILPATGNQVIATLKATSLVLLIGIPDLMTNVQQIYNANFRQVPLLMVACAWYLALTSLLSLAQHQLERRANRAERGSRP